MVTKSEQSYFNLSHFCLQVCSLIQWPVLETLQHALLSQRFQKHNQKETAEQFDFLFLSIVVTLTSVMASYFVNEQK